MPKERADRKAETISCDAISTSYSHWQLLMHRQDDFSYFKCCWSFCGLSRRSFFQHDQRSCLFWERATICSPQGEAFAFLRNTETKFNLWIYHKGFVGQSSNLGFSLASACVQESSSRCGAQPRNWCGLCGFLKNSELLQSCISFLIWRIVRIRTMLHSCRGDCSGLLEKWLVGI